jgi:hypothetical protein
MHALHDDFARAAIDAIASSEGIYVDTLWRKRLAANMLAIDALGGRAEGIYEQAFKLRSCIFAARQTNQSQ